MMALKDRYGLNDEEVEMLDTLFTACTVGTQQGRKLGRDTDRELAKAKKGK